MPSRFQPIQAGTDPSQQLAMINKNFGELDAESVKKLFYDNNGIPSIQIGVQQDGSSRIKVSKPGVDVTMATDDQLAFNSSQDVLKVVKTGLATVPGTSISTAAGAYASQQTTVTIAHGLSFIPAIICYDNSGGYTSLPYDFVVLSSSSGYVRKGIIFSVDATNIYIYMNAFAFNTTSAFTLNPVQVKYFLLQETAN